MVNQKTADVLEKQIKLITSLNEINEIENSLGCVDGRSIGTGRADYTKGSEIYNLVVQNKKFALIDIPGIEGNESNYKEIIIDALEKAHAIFYVNGSSKKIEYNTLEKIKKYMHDGTSVYAIFNVHCKPKKERILEIDKSYSEELSNEYEKYEEIINQTEVELKSFLGDNFKGSFSLNGLLAFCSLAITDCGQTSIIDETDKYTRADQVKYLNEYSGNLELMLKESRIHSVNEIVNLKTEKFDEYIYEENIKKLKNRMAEMIDEIKSFKKAESAKIRGFINIYTDFESNCYNAKEDFIQSIKHIGRSSVDEIFVEVEEELFSLIEDKQGRIKSDDIEQYFIANKGRISLNIQNSVNLKFKNAQDDYEESMKDAYERLIKDYSREQVKFEVPLLGSKVLNDTSFLDSLKYNLKDFGGHLLTTGGLALSGATVGSLIAPGIGTAVGAAVGALLGILSSVWNFFASEAKRISRAKEKMHRAIDELADEISADLSQAISDLNCEDKINYSYENINDKIKEQKKSLLKVEKVLETVLDELKLSYNRKI